jgi:hypothetical protein
MFAIPRKAAIRLLKLILGLILIYAVGRHVGDIWLDLERRGELPGLDASWLGLAVVLYVAGLVIDGAWFGRIMSRSDSPVPLMAAIRAYIISHLGKYVPGKALVVLMRVALVVPAGARTATAAIATFYETLVMMAAGGVVAFLGLGLSAAAIVSVNLGPLGTLRLAPGALGLALGLAFLAVIWPTVFPVLVRIASLPFARGSSAWRPTCFRLLGEGMMLSAIGWMFFGLSQIAAIRAIHPAGLDSDLWPVAIGSVALATVAGFVIPVAPGGLGVREWVLWTSLGVALDHDRAVLSSLVLRMAWIVGELAAAAALLPLRPSSRPSPATADSGEAGAVPTMAPTRGEHLRVPVGNLSAVKLI